MTPQTWLPLAIVLSSLLPGLVIFALREEQQRLPAQGARREGREVSGVEGQHQHADHVLPQGEVAQELKRARLHHGPQLDAPPGQRVLDVVADGERPVGQREGVRDLRQSGLVKVRLGVTSLEEVITVTNE